MTNKEKLEFIKSEFNAYISNIETLAQFKAFLNNVTKAKIINYLKARLQDHIDTHSKYATDEEARVTEVTDLKNNLENFLG